ncbi:aldo/keto reductase [Kitasatospora sp. NPDC051914]|uniref:aldo/keto reductase n=1 Tax=Kitasatospora sp. NPDC051914 TaxID=3154945 RepID=UPI003449B5AE
MENRTLGRTGRKVGVIGLGAWQLGADWGRVDEADALGTLDAALESGVSFIDTADEYGDGRSEQIIGRLLSSRARSGAALPTVATKMGRRAPQVAANYNAANFRVWVDRSRRNLGVERLDLVQLHCPPPEVYFSNEVFDALDALVECGAIAAYGISVRSCEQALAAIRRPNLATIQLVLNAFRLKPLEQVLPAAAEAGVGVVARVPLASGLLSGRYTAATVFGADDHRTYNRHGESFDVGETFSGLDFATGLEAVERLRPLVPEGAALAQFALRWIVDQEAVSVVVPGARNAGQARANAAAAALAPLDRDALRAVREVYDELIRPQVHHRW